jgi:hypothetical protein
MGFSMGWDHTSGFHRRGPRPFVEIRNQLITVIHNLLQPGLKIAKALEDHPVAASRRSPLISTSHLRLSAKSKRA